MPSPDLLLAFYGDDFSGSTDVLESLEAAGVASVLFLDPPDQEALERHPGVRAVGVAGMTRAQAPAEMTPVLDDAFRRLGRLAPRVVQYKVCSTFDSSPAVGSIGRALEIGASVFASPFVPLVVGAPRLGRFSAFGQLFARANGEVMRLDRHPTMSRHPLTPMDEADLRLHLKRQTQRRTALFDVLALDGIPADVASRFSGLLRGQPDNVLFDVLSDAHLLAIGRLLWAEAGQRTLFAAGSVGLTDALCAEWRAAGLCAPPSSRAVPAVDRLLVISGSASPTTAEQIAAATAQGFAEVALDTLALGPEEEGRGRDRAALALEEGRSVVVHAARGPNDPRLGGRGESARGRAAAVGGALASIARGVLERTGVRRLVVAGGDTAGRVARALGLEALAYVAATAPGSPLCRAHATGALAGLELVFKGGQVGDRDFFSRVRDGRFPA